MQQCLHGDAGSGAPFALLGSSGVAVRHRGLILIRPRGASRLTPRLSRRVLDRLLVPAAQVEGVDLHLGDEALRDEAARACAFALLLPPLGNLSNPFYAVHPRRNDRFLAARDPLRALFPEVDFAAFAFTGHVLGHLAGVCPERFSLLRKGLAEVWGTRMHRLLAGLPHHGALLDLPTPPWLPRPLLMGEGRRCVLLDPDDRARGAAAMLGLLRQDQAPSVLAD